MMKKREGNKEMAAIAEAAMKKLKIRTRETSSTGSRNKEQIQSGANPVG